MKTVPRIFLLTLVLIVACAVGAQTIKGVPDWELAYRHDGVAFLPNLKFTPGVSRNVTVQQLCSTSTKTVRKTTEVMKIEAYTKYGVHPHAGVCAKGCEVDHLIALEDGGADTELNLWPQPYFPRPGAHEKDQLEDLLHREICSGKISVADAQVELTDDWYKAYLAAGLDKEKK